MIKRIELNNFMSHKHTVIEPAAGLTVLLGANNVGKSAIIAALQILCYNKKPQYAMRHGAKRYSIVVETDDGHVVQYNRTKTATSYLIDGEKFDRLGQSNVPEELHKVLKLPKVEGNGKNGKEGFDVHFGSQKTPIFLLDEPGTAAARFFASSSDASRLLKMRQKHREKIRDAKRERTLLDKKSKQLNTELTALEPVSDIERFVEKVEDDYQKLLELQRNLGDLERAKKMLVRQHHITDAHSAEADALSELNSPPELTAIEPIQQTIDAIVRASNQEKLASKSLDATQDLAEPPALQETTSLETTITQLTRYDYETKVFSKQQTALKTLSSPPQLASPLAFEGLIHQLENATMVFDRLSEQTSLLSKIQPVEFKEEGPLAELLNSLKANLLEEQSLQRQIDLLDELETPALPAETTFLQKFIKELTLSEQEFKAQQAETEVLKKELAALAETLRQATLDQSCPVCGGPLDAERLLEQARSSAP